MAKGAEYAWRVPTPNAFFFASSGSSLEKPRVAKSVNRRVRIRIRIRWCRGAERIGPGSMGPVIKEPVSMELEKTRFALAGGGNDVSAGHANIQQTPESDGGWDL